MEIIISGKRILIDKEDSWLFKRSSWYFAAKGYLQCSYKGKKNYLHREIMGFPKDKIVDHINRDKTDNRKSNLRIVSPSINSRNASKRITNTSGYIGVTWNKYRGKWQAQIKASGVYLFLGFYDDPKSAALIYDRVKLEVHKKEGEMNMHTYADLCISMQSALPPRKGI